MHTMLNSVVRAMDRIAPLKFAETAWDNVGVLVECPYPRQHASTVLLTIDLTKDVVSEAIDDPSCGVIVAYHPPIFRGWKQLTMSKPGNPESVKQEIALKCAASGISIYSPHTSLDAAVGGSKYRFNDWLASCLGPGTRIPAAPSKEGTGQEGSGRLVTLDKPLTLLEAVDRIKAHLKLKHVRVAESHGSSRIETVGICAGSGSSVLLPLSPPPDLIFTGEMSHHEVLQAVANNTSVILCEHTNTERGFLEAVLAEKLYTELKKEDDGGFDVVVSKFDEEPLVIM
ncbi:GTP cyclohydrolase 1 type 2/Nif3 [Paraphysoderma sedebokerense]|nr:GTP cyclohydrolase 1 type 2/Nif3 [Paraphysoderma sedebokerense]